MELPRNSIPVMGSLVWKNSGKFLLYIPAESKLSPCCVRVNTKKLHGNKMSENYANLVRQIRKKSENFIGRIYWSPWIPSAMHSQFSGFSFFLALYFEASSHANCVYFLCLLLS